MSDIQSVIQEQEDQSKAALDSFKRELQKVRTGRASTGLVATIQVDIYGSRMPLEHCGQISTPEPQMITITAYDPSTVSAIEKAIQNSGLGFNPSTEGSVIRVLVPALTEERRREIIKHLNKLGEDIKVSIRNHRRDANEALKKLEKDAGLSKDDSKRGQDKVQKNTDAFIVEVDKMLAAKEAECSSI